MYAYIIASELDHKNSQTIYKLKHSQESYSQAGVGAYMAHRGE